ncbi:hypothetical protein GCM10009744_35130 [Kribbella alba]|uniref:Uncharacterized protein n=1 Tax=Kribbella alba TaxID=190197 RepID=A0ABN2FDJ4_9ACTN
MNTKQGPRTRNNVFKVPTTCPRSPLLVRARNLAPTIGLGELMRRADYRGPLESLIRRFTYPIAAATRSRSSGSRA